MDDTIVKLHTEKTWTGFFYSLIGVTLPFTLSLIGILIIKKYDFIVSFIDDGQILLFAVGLLSSAFYIFRDESNQKSLKKAKLKIDRLISHFTILFLIVSAVMYAIIYSFTLMETEATIATDITINTWFIRISSVLIFIFALYASYSSIYVDFLKVYPIVDVKKESTKGVKDLLDKL